LFARNASEQTFPLDFGQETSLQRSSTQEKLQANALNIDDM